MPFLKTGLECQNIQITLYGGALAAQGWLQGLYLKSITINGKLSWKNTSTKMEIWWDARAPGKLGSKGSDRDHWKVGSRKMHSRYLDTYDSSPSVSGPPYGNVDQWSYFNGKNWEKPVDEIFVECAPPT